MKRNLVANLLISNLVLLFLSGCLKMTVNVNFPESAVQQATDSYVHNLYKQKEKGKPAKQDTQSSDEEEPNAQPSQTPAKPSSDKHSQLNMSILTNAWAGEEVSLQFTINTPKAKRITEKLAANLSEVLVHKKSGILGETNEGKLIIKAPEKLKKLLQAKVEKLVADENTAREELYAEVVSSNKIAKDRAIDVKKSFARSFEAESPAGTWIQDEEGNWSQKE